MPCHVEMQDTPPVVADDEEAIQYVKRDRWNGEEVHRREDFSMITQKSEPTFRKFRIPWCFAHPARNSSLGDVEPEQEKLPVDARCSPGRILGNHLKDQISNLFRDSASPDRLPLHLGQDVPIEPKSGLVPLDDRFGKNDDEEPLPIGPDPPRRDPKQFVQQMESWSRMATLEHCELLSQNE